MVRLRFNVNLSKSISNSDSTGMQHLLHTEMQVNRNDLLIASMQYCSELPLCDYDCNHQMI